MGSGIVQKVTFTWLSGGWCAATTPFSDRSESTPTVPDDLIQAYRYCGCICDISDSLIRWTQAQIDHLKSSTSPNIDQVSTEQSSVFTAMFGVVLPRDVEDANILLGNTLRIVAVRNLGDWLTASVYVNLVAKPTCLPIMRAHTVFELELG